MSIVETQSTFDAIRAVLNCECADPGCPVGHTNMCQNPADCTLTRVDMEHAHVHMCADCAADGLASGVFA